MPLPKLAALDYALTALAIGGCIGLNLPKIRNANFWRATVTPLASIIGSGFLVVVPLLAHTTGSLSLAAILGIVLISLWLGSAMRFNILHLPRLAQLGDRRAVDILERLSNLALLAAYTVSVAFYVRLLSSFALTAFGSNSELYGNILTTVLLSGIGLYGLSKGLHGLERLEEYSVSVKLAIILALLVGLAYHDVTPHQSVPALHLPTQGWWHSVQVLFGMLLIVQGFETSKYLGSAYSENLRAKSMLLAQLIAGVIYVLFVLLALPTMGQFYSVKPSETAVIDLSRDVSVALPALLIIAAIMSQFSAAVADTIGSGGVAEYESNQRVSPRYAYLAVVALSIGLVWVSNIFEIIALASKTFAFYYLLQAALAFWLAKNLDHIKFRKFRIVSFASLVCLMFIVVLVAKSAES